MASVPVETTEAPDAPVEDRKLRKVVFAASAGTIFEAYDFILFGSLAPLISRQFFSQVNEATGFIFALLTFAAGFVVRPFGALVFGRMGDSSGRKKTFLITITVMGLATFGIGLLPTYASVGILAPILLIALRLIQGLAYGGEYGGAVIYTAEHAPAAKRGLYVGWIQTAGGFALFLSFLVIFLTRSTLGEARFEDWGWRVPFLISILLLGISLWVRMTLDESPAFKKMLAEGKASKRPLSEAFLQWRNLRLVLIVLFGMMSVQGVLWYTAHFYTQFFLTQILHVAPARITLVMMLVTIVSVGLYILFSWLSDKVGRKPIMLAGMILSVVTAFPLFHALTAAVNPALAEAQARAPVIVHADPAQCSVQFDPLGSARFDSSCDIATGALARAGISYDSRDDAAGGVARVTIGDRVVASDEGRALDPAALKALRGDVSARIDAALAEAGYPAEADPARVNLVAVFGIILLLVTFSVMCYAPIPAMVVEVFPTRIRYSALSLPYHIGSGWFGGFLPAIVFAIVAATGNIYSGLWYPVIVTAIGVVVLAFLLPERLAIDLDEA